MLIRIITTLILVTSCSLWALPAAAKQNLQDPYRIIVKFADPTIWKRYQVMNRQMENLTGVPTTKAKPLGGGMVAFHFNKAEIERLSQIEGKKPERLLEEIRTKVATGQGIQFATVDKLNKINQISHALQWDEFAPPGGIQVEGNNGAWQWTQGDPNVTVAVLDTGIVQHPDLLPNILPGFNMIDGNEDTTDLGITTYYHGTHVAGTIAANGKLLGIAPYVKILPIKVCNGDGCWDSDVIAGIYWASGMAVGNYPVNSTPAKVMNLSLGGDSSICPPSYRDAIYAATKLKNVAVVVAAGNSYANAALSSPANCFNTITVAATNRQGLRSSYSNFGKTITIAAPGGDNTPVAEDGILSTVGTSDHGFGYAYYAGTSMAAPHVTGVIALMLSVNPNLTYQEVKQIIQETAIPFPVATGYYNCQMPYGCGMGIINAANAVQSAAYKN